MIVNGALSGLVAITAACAFVESWAAIVIGFIAGLATMWTAYFIDRKGIDDPIYAFSVHGIAGIWGTLSTGFFASPRLVEKIGIGRAGLLYGGGIEQLIVQFVGVMVSLLYVAVVSFIILWTIRKFWGIRVTQEEESLGLDVSEHGSYGYPEHLHVIKIASMIGK